MYERSRISYRCKLMQIDLYHTLNYPSSAPTGSLHRNPCNLYTVFLVFCPGSRLGDLWLKTRLTMIVQKRDSQNTLMEFDGWQHTQMASEQLGYAWLVNSAELGKGERTPGTPSATFVFNQTYFPALVFNVRSGSLAIRPGNTLPVNDKCACLEVCNTELRITDS